MTYLSSIDTYNQPRKLPRFKHAFGSRVKQIQYNSQSPRKYVSKANLGTLENSISSSAQSRKHDRGIGTRGVSVPPAVARSKSSVIHCLGVECSRLQVARSTITRQTVFCGPSTVKQQGESRPTMVPFQGSTAANIRWRHQSSRKINRASISFNVNGSAEAWVLHAAASRNCP